MKSICDVMCKRMEPFGVPHEFKHLHEHNTEIRTETCRRQNQRCHFRNCYKLSHGTGNQTLCKENVKKSLSLLTHSIVFNLHNRTSQRLDLQFEHDLWLIKAMLQSSDVHDQMNWMKRSHNSHNLIVCTRIGKFSNIHTWKSYRWNDEYVMWIATYKPNVSKSCSTPNIGWHFSWIQMNFKCVTFKCSMFNYISMNSTNIFHMFPQICQSFVARCGQWAFQNELWTLISNYFNKNCIEIERRT